MRPEERQGYVAGKAATVRRVAPLIREVALSDSSGWSGVPLLQALHPEVLTALQLTRVGAWGGRDGVPAVAAALGAVLRRCTALTRLGLYESALPADAAAVLGALTQLRHLDLCNPPDEAVGGVAHLRRLTWLCIECRGEDEALPDGVGDVLRQLPCLVHLELGDSPIHIVPLHLPAPATWPALRSCSLDRQCGLMEVRCQRGVPACRLGNLARPAWHAIHARCVRPALHADPGLAPT